MVFCWCVLQSNQHNDDFDFVSWNSNQSNTIEYTAKFSWKNYTHAYIRNMHTHIFVDDIRKSIKIKWNEFELKIIIKIICCWFSPFLLLQFLQTHTQFTSHWLHCVVAAYVFNSSRHKSIRNDATVSKLLSIHTHTHTIYTKKEDKSKQKENEKKMKNGCRWLCYCYYYCCCWYYYSSSETYNLTRRLLHTTDV